MLATGDDAPLVIAVDWSGRAKGAQESIWLAVVDGGRLVELENGFSRGQVIEAMIGRAGERSRAVVGLDFAFSFPAWFCAAQGWETADAAWAAMRDDGEALLAACEDPFWGRAGRTAQRLGVPLRSTEAESPGAKSVFQIGGAGAVGTGSVRGMPHLLTLAEAGFSIWPFHAPGPKTVVEIYPRVLTPRDPRGRAVVKSRHRARRESLDRQFGDSGLQDPVLLERAAGSEDAFDAAVSALRMGEHLGELLELPTHTPDDVRRIEGAIWKPRLA